MKLGKFISTMEDLNVVPEEKTALQKVEEVETPQSLPDDADPSGVKAVEYEFPDEFVPDELDINLLKQTNESLMTNGDLAAQQIDAMKDSIDIIRDSKAVTPLTAKVIQVQLANMRDVFPETRLQQYQYLEQHMTSESPLVVEATVESLENGMSSLRPIVTRTFQVAKNIAGFLARSEEVSLFDDRLESAKRALMRTDRNEDIEDKEEASTDFHHDRWRDLFPKIVKAVQAGYTSADVPSIIGTDNDDDRIPETAIIAISKGIEKLPLSHNRALTGMDLGSLVDFIKETSQFQDEAIAVFSQLVGQQPKEQTPGAQTSISAMNLGATADGILANILKKRDAEGNALYRTYADGPYVIFTPQGRSMAPETDGATNFGWIEPNDLSDMVVAIQEKISPALLSLKKNAQVLGQIATVMEGRLGAALGDRVQMADQQGVELTTSFNKLTAVMKFVNDMVTTSVETSLKLVAGVTDIARGVSIIVET